MANNQGNNTEIPGTPVEPTTPNTNPGTTTPNQTTGGTTTNPSGNNTTTGIEETIRKEKQKVFEDLRLSWTTIGIPAITANMGIFKPELQIEKTATAVIREGEAEQIPVIKENKPMVRAGDTIIYTIQVSNLGNYKATNVVVTDSLDVIFDGKTVPANEELAKIETLEAGKVATLKVGYVVKQEDIDAVLETEQNEIISKDIINIATATDGKTTVEDDDDMPVNPDVTINVNKNWQDNDNQDGKRPEKITVELYRNNENEPVETVTIDASSEWKHVFSNLPKYDEDKNEITYRVVEVTVPEYDKEYEISDNGVEIHNHHTPETTEVSGSKTWDDKNNQDGIRPDSITVRLFADGTEVTSKTVTANDNWSWSFTDLDKYNSGTEIVYTISEDTVADYTTVVDGYNITNTHTPEKTIISGSKTWNDNNNQDGKRPDSITVRLFADGTEVTSKEVTANDNWSWSFTGLDKYNSGTEIVYTISEDAVTDYTTEVKGYNVTNTHTPEKISITKATTNDEGMVQFSNLHLGKYYVKETNAPEGYLLNNKEFDAELKYKDANTKVIYIDVQGIKDEEPTGTITIIKKDAETGSVPQGDATFNGAVYKVYANEDIYNKAKTKKFYSNGDLVATRTINEKGETEDIKNLPLGKYIVKEETNPTGYMLDKNTYNVELKYKDQYTKVIADTKTSLENVKKMGVHIFKSGIKENSGETLGLEGAEFTIKLNSAVEKAYEKGYTYAEVWNGIDENGNQVKVDSKRVKLAQAIAPSYAVIVTDKDGNAYTKNNLPYGKYIVKETKTPTDYETAVDFTFSITEDESEIKEISKKTKHIVVNNEQLETYIKLIKRDLKTNKLVTLNSTTFEIKATKDIYDRATKKILFKKGESISQKIGNTTYTSFTTNADNIVVPDNSFNSKNDDKAKFTTPSITGFDKELENS